MYRFTWEADFLRWLHSLSNVILDAFFWLITEIGSEIILIGLIGLLYYCFNKKWAKRIAFIGLTSGLINNFLKDLINAQLPYEVQELSNLKDPHPNFFEKNAYSSATGQSFPSGHSQNSATLYTSLIVTIKKRKLSILCIAIIILVPLSRLYFGVHFPMDTIVGTALGIVIALGLNYLLNWFEKKNYSEFILYLSVLVIFIPSFFIDTFKTNPDLFKLFGLYTGFCIAMFIEKKWINFDYDVKPFQKVLRIVIGMVIIIGVKSGIKILLPDLLWAHYLRYLLISLLSMGFFPLLFKNRIHQWGI